MLLNDEDARRHTANGELLMALHLRRPFLDPIHIHRRRCPGKEGAQPLHGARLALGVN